MPFPSAINSLNWTPAEEREELPIGEVPSAPRKWRDGSMPGRPPGQDFHGEPEWYVEGCPPGLNVERRPSGILLECSPPIRPAGGVGVGGPAPPARYNVPSVVCPGTKIPSTIYSQWFVFPPFTWPFAPGTPAVYDPSPGVGGWVLHYPGGLDTTTGVTIPPGRIIHREVFPYYYAEVQSDPAGPGQTAPPNATYIEHGHNCGSSWVVQWAIPFVWQNGTPISYASYRLAFVPNGG